MVAVAHGNDMGGSIRIPASECGLVGLKPTRARNSLGPDFGEFWAISTHEHVLTRSVRDTAAVLDATAGMAPGDPYTAPPPARPFRDEVGADPGRLRIGVRTRRRGSGDESASRLRRRRRGDRAALESLGHHVEPTEIPALDDPALDDAIGGTFSVFVARDLDRWRRRSGATIDPSELEPCNAQMRRERTHHHRGHRTSAALERANDYCRRARTVVARRSG